MTTNNINGKIYIGKKTSSTFLKEEYLGSGVAIKRAIKKYSKENFSVEMLCSCESLEELNGMEKYFIKEYNSQDKNIGYNILPGGDGGSIFGHPPTFTRKHTEEERHKMSVKSSNQVHTKERDGQVASHHMGSKMMTNGTEQKWVYKEDIQTMVDSGWSFGSCKKRNRDYTGKNNPMYGKAASTGKKWIHRIDNNKIIKTYVSKDELEHYLSNGWELGMK